MNSNIIIKIWNGYEIRFREDKYVNLTDLVEATGENISEFLNHKRTLEIICAFYQQQTGTIQHPIEHSDNEIWVENSLACEFAYQCSNKEFTIWANQIL